PLLPSSAVDRVNERTPGQRLCGPCWQPWRRTLEGCSRQILLEIRNNQFRLCEVPSQPAPKKTSVFLLSGLNDSLIRLPAKSRGPACRPLAIQFHERRFV